jgi:hypothetical protein
MAGQNSSALDETMISSLIAKVNGPHEERAETGRRSASGEKSPYHSLTSGQNA